jgi:hypothetical protein
MSILKKVKIKLDFNLWKQTWSFEIEITYCETIKVNLNQG